MNKSIQGNATANGIVEQAKQTVANVAADAKAGVQTQLEHKVDQAKGIGLEKIETVSEALRGASEKLEGTGPLPQLANKAAEGIENLAHYFENKNIGDLFTGIETFARRQPVMFLGSAVALGVIAGRFLKSSARRPAAGSQYGYSGGEIDQYETFGYEGTEGDFLAADDLEDDWDTASSEDTLEEPMAFESESNGIGVTPSASSGASTDFGRTTQPQGSSVGGVGIGSSSRGGTEKMPVTQGSIGGGLSGSASGRSESSVDKTEEMGGSDDFFGNKSGR